MATVGGYNPMSNTYVPYANPNVYNPTPNTYVFDTSVTTSSLEIIESIEYLIEDDQNGEVYGMTPGGIKVNITKYINKQIINLIKNKLEEIIAEENPVEQDMEILAKYREMLNFLIEEVNLAKKYLKLAEDLTDDRSGLDAVSRTLPECPHVAPGTGACPLCRITEEDDQNGG